MAAKGKTISSSTPSWMKGGGTGKVGKQTSTGTQKPGQSAQMGRNGKPAKGGGSDGIGKQHTGTQRPGQSAQVRGGKK